MAERASRRRPSFLVLLLLLVVSPFSRAYQCFEPNDNAVLINAIRDYISTPLSALNATSARNVYGPVIGDWCVDRLVSFNDAFASRSSFNEPLTNWNTSSATSMERMFSGAFSFNQNVSHFDTSRVTSMYRMFSTAVAFTGVGLPPWDVSKVGSMYQMFQRSKVNQDISSWDVRNANDMQDMFRNVSHFNQNLCAWGPRLNATKLAAASKLNSMFLYTGCPVQSPTSLATNPRGPFCWSCSALPPRTAKPTMQPTSPKPTRFPTRAPSVKPTKPPSAASMAPTKAPTNAPNKPPTRFPTTASTGKPTKPPSSASMAPTKAPSKLPTRFPTTAPTGKPTKPPSLAAMGPTKAPTKAPTMPTAPPINPGATNPPTMAFVDAWTSLNENQNYLARSECSFVQAGDKFYLLGGREDPRRVDRYDYASNSWSTGASAPKDFNHFQAVTYQGLIWVIAAFNTNTYPNEVNEPNVHVYDPAANVWMVGPSIPLGRRRGGAGVAVYNDQFYVVGGNSLGHNGGAVAYLDRYDPRANTWEALANAPNARDHFEAVVVAATSKLYSIGGRATDLPSIFDNITAMVDEYDFATGTWQTLPGVTLPSPRAGASNVYFRGKILVIGGESSSQTAAFQRVDAFDPVTKTFALAAPLKFARHATQALVSGPGVIITGGSPKRGDGYQTNMEAYSQFAPVGVPSSPGVLTLPTGNVSIYKDQVMSVNIVHSSGSTGVLVQSISFQGIDASLFNFPSVPSAPFLIGQSESRTVGVRYSGNKALAVASMVVTYSGSQTLVLPLQGINTILLSTSTPTTQPTPVPAPTLAPTPTSRFGTTCFPADGNALRSSVPTYLTVVQNLPTLGERLNHSLSVTYGYPIGYWCVSRVTNMRDVFRASNTDTTDPRRNFNEPLTYWNTSSATTMSYTFFRAERFDQDLSGFDTSRVTDMNHCFRFAVNFTGKGIQNFDTSRVTNMWNMFNGASNFNGNISQWNTANPAMFSPSIKKTMFQDAVRFNQDLSNWNVTKVVDASSMFRYATSFNKSLCAWGSRLTNTTLLTDMFVGTSCPFALNTPWFTYSPPGPFCYDCCCRPALPSAIVGPIEVPLVPALASNLFSDLIVAWSGNARYRFGYGSGGTYTTLFDPISHASTLRNVDETGHNMFCPGTAQLADGRILVTGGSSSDLTSIYDPRSDAWTLGAKMSVARGYQSQFTLSDGRVFVFGGSWNGGIGGKIGEVYTEFPNGTANWTAKPGITTIPSCVTNDTQGLYRSDSHMWMFEHKDGRILQAGPSRQMHWISLEGNGTITPTAFRGDDGDAMVGGAVYYDLDKIFTVGGAAYYDSGPASKRAYIIDMNGTEPVVERQPDMIWPRAFINTVVLPNGWIVCAGGQMKVKLFSDDDNVLPIEIFDPVAKRFHEVSTPLKVPRTYHSAGVLAKDGRVVIGGGGLCGAQCDYGSPINHPDFEILSPPYLFDSSGALAVRPVIIAVSNPSTFSVNGTIVVTMDTTGSHTFSLIRTGVATHSTNLDQRRVPLVVSQQMGPTFTLQVPPSPVHVPPGGYWLFAMNAAGVPSVGYSLFRSFP